MSSISVLSFLDKWTSFLSPPNAQAGVLIYFSVVIFPTVSWPGVKTCSRNVNPAQRRLLRDLKRLQSDPPPGICGSPVDDNVMVWNAIIFGPDKTAFEDGTFKLRLDFTEDYPNKPPRVVFTSKVFHPNVYTDGSICLDILSSAWSPTYDVLSILTSISPFWMSQTPIHQLTAWQLNFT
ncbi:unnamed protein product [Heterobilharzia americana]|nr:unnamed protein product [Heterobilharzia americana]